jgi:hypothetical protein
MLTPTYRLPAGDISQAPETKQPMLVPWTTEQARGFGLQPLVAQHRLHEHDLFTDGALMELLRNYPRDQIQAFTMGTNPLNYKEWYPVDTTGASAEDVFAAIARGRLWFKMLQIERVDRNYRAVIEQLYAELCQLCSDFQPQRLSGTLLISSPTALVYYHADAEPNLLWQIRGSKRVWVYPPADTDIVPQDLMEDIFAHVVDEEAPYRPEFDQKASIFDLFPGEVISWPLNAPHRVTNLDGVNISLSTQYQTDESECRKLLYCANRLLRRRYHIPAQSTKETGFVPVTKRLVYRILRRAGRLPPAPRRAYITDMRIDPNAPHGISIITSGPVLTEFSQKEFSITRDDVGRRTVVQANQAR